MASFDIIDAANYGYREAWRHRGYLARLAAVPLVLDILGYFLILSLGWNLNFVRQALVMLPAIFAQGWMLSHYVRLLFLGQRWPFQPSGNLAADKALLTDRLHGISAGTLLFALSHFICYGCSQVFYHLNEMSVHESRPPTPNDFAAGVFALACLWLAFWSFRLLTFFIPAALDQKLLPILVRLKGMKTSFFIIATWMVCYMPLTMLIALASIALQEGTTHPNLAFNFLQAALLGLRDMGVAFVVTGGIAYGYRVMLAPPRARF